MWIHKSGLFVQPSIPIEKQKNSLYVDQAVCSVHKNGLVRTHIFLYERNIATGSFFYFLSGKNSGLSCSTKYAYSH